MPGSTGGTRTASICAGYLALRDAIAKLPGELPLPKTGAVLDSAGRPLPRYDASFYDPASALVDELAAVSVGVIGDAVRLDLDYIDDSAANVDMNVAFTAGGKFVELQGSAENGEGFATDKLMEMVELATKGCRQLHEIMRTAR